MRGRDFGLHPCAWCGAESNRTFVLVGVTVCDPCRDAEIERTKPIGQAEFVERLTTHAVPLSVAAWCHRRRFPTGPRSDRLTDEARGRLWAMVWWAMRGRYAGMVTGTATGAQTDAPGRPSDPFPSHLLPRTEVPMAL